MDNRKAKLKHEPFRLVIPEGLSYAYIGLPIKPKAKARGRIAVTKYGKKYIYKTAADRQWGKTVRDLLLEQYGIGKTPLDDNNGLTMITIFEIKKREKYLWGEPVVARPDLSNYIKNIEDELNEVVYTDDAGIFQIYSLKLYNDRDYVNIILIPGKNYVPLLGAVLKESAVILSIINNSKGGT